MKTAHDITEPEDIARHIIYNTGRDAIVLVKVFEDLGKAMITDIIGDNDTWTKLISLKTLEAYRNSPMMVVVEA